MSSKLSLVAIEKEGIVRVATTGDLSVAEMHPLGKNPLEQILGVTWSMSRVLLDMRLTRFIDSAAIGWLISSHREFRAKGGALAVYGIDSRVRRMLEILKVEQIIVLAADEANARAALAKAAA